MRCRGTPAQHPGSKHLAVHYACQACLSHVTWQGCCDQLAVHMVAAGAGWQPPLAAFRSIQQGWNAGRRLKAPAPEYVEMQAFHTQWLLSCTRQVSPLHKGNLLMHLLRHCIWIDQAPCVFIETCNSWRSRTARARSTGQSLLLSMHWQYSSNVSTQPSYTPSTLALQGSKERAPLGQGGHPNGLLRG
jgi:hypothetical protein